MQHLTGQKFKPCESCGFAMGVDAKTCPYCEERTTKRLWALVRWSLVGLAGWAIFLYWEPLQSRRTRVATFRATPTPQAVVKPASAPTEPTSTPAPVESVALEEQPVAPQAAERSSAPPLVAAMTPVPVSLSPVPVLEPLPPAPLPALSPTPPKLAAFITLDAREVATGKRIDHKWESGWGSYDREFYRDKKVAVVVRNVSRAPGGKCELRVVWLSKILSSGDIHAHFTAKQALEVSPLFDNEFQFTCPAVKGRVENYAALGEKYVSGAKLFGWVAVVVREGAVIAARGASPEQQGVLKNKVALERILKESSR